MIDKSILNSLGSIPDLGASLKKCFEELNKFLKPKLGIDEVFAAKVIGTEVHVSYTVLPKDRKPMSRAVIKDSDKLNDRAGVLQLLIMSGVTYLLVFEDVIITGDPYEKEECFLRFGDFEYQLY